MGRFLAKYFQITGYFLLGVGLGVATLWLSQHWSDLLPAAFQTAFERTGADPEATPAGRPAEPNPRVGLLLASRLPEGDVLGGWPEAATLNRDFRVLGHAVIVDDQRLLTAAHVVDGLERVYFYNNTLGLLPADLSKRTPTHDLAWGDILSPTSLGMVATTSAAVAGEPVHMWVKKGFETVMIEGEIISGGKSITLQEAWGEILGKRVPVVAARMQNTLGDSGSPVFDKEQRLLGVVVGVDLDDLTVSYISTWEKGGSDIVMTK